MQWLRSLVRRSPKAAMVLGKTVFLAGSLLVVGALFARTSLVADYPQLAWLVPQGPVGYGIAAALVLVGMVITVFASEAQKR
jgi:hypothetical protein